MLNRGSLDGNDGKIVVDEPQTLYQAGKYQHVPIMIGANSADMGMSRATTVEQIFSVFGEKQKAAEEANDASSSKNLHDLATTVASDAMMVEPARFVAQTLSMQGVPAWEFRFSYVAESMRKDCVPHHFGER